MIYMVQEIITTCLQHNSQESVKHSWWLNLHKIILRPLDTLRSSIAKMDKTARGHPTKLTIRRLVSCFIILLLCQDHQGVREQHKWGIHERAISYIYYTLTLWISFPHPHISAKKYHLTGHPLSAGGFGSIIYIPKKLTHVHATGYYGKAHAVRTNFRREHI